VSAPKRRRFDVEAWSDADKVLLVSALTVPFTLGWLARSLAILRDPTLSTYVSRSFLPVNLAFVAAQTLAHVGLIGAAFALRRDKGARRPCLVAVEIHVWFASLAFSLYVLGPFTSSFGVLAVAVPVIGFIIFEARAMKLGLVTYGVGMALAIGLPLAGLAPYAPFLAEAPFSKGALHPAWILSMGVPSVFATVAVLFVFTTLLRRLRERQAELEIASSTDPLTSLANRRTFFQRLGEEIARARRHRRPLSVLMIDVDHFKAINDVHGHLAGDDVLRRLAARIQEALRTADVAARYGGEEFSLLLPETSLEGARVVADRLLSVGRTVGVRAEEGSETITVSVGLAELSPEDRADDLVARADAALYRAKRSGRDRLSIADADADADADASS